MLKLQAITAHHYKSFEPQARLELRPLTLLLGRNNAGKSSLLRLLPILARSTSEAANKSPFDLGGVDTRGADEQGPIAFTNFVWNHRDTLSLELEWRDGARGIKDLFTISFNTKSSQVYIKSLIIKADQEEVFSAASVPTEDGADYNLMGPDRSTQLLFSGLCPREDPPYEALLALRQRMRSLGGKVQWLSATRQQPPRLIPKINPKTTLLADDGRNAAAFVCADESMLDAVSPWFAGSELRRRLHVSSVDGTYFKLMLDRLNQSGALVELLDTGEGMTQVLPVLVAAELARREGSAAILAIEDPEDQLHENARAALAEHLAEIASAPDAPRMVLETHSRTFLLGVQLAIAKGILPPENVAAYWVAQGDDGRSVASLVEFDRLGAPKTSALNGLLAEDRKMARELLSLQLNSTR